MVKLPEIMATFYIFVYQTTNITNRFPYFSAEGLIQPNKTDIFFWGELDYF